MNIACPTCPRRGSLDLGPAGQRFDLYGVRSTACTCQSERLELTTCTDTQEIHDPRHAHRWTPCTGRAFRLGQSGDVMRCKHSKQMPHFCRKTGLVLGLGMRLGIGICTDTWYVVLVTQVVRLGRNLQRIPYPVRSSNGGLRSIRATASLLGFLGSTQPTQPERPKTGLTT